MGWLVLVPDENGHLIPTDPKDVPNNFFRHYQDPWEEEDDLDEELQNCPEGNIPKTATEHNKPAGPPPFSDNEQYVLLLLSNRSRLLAGEQKARKAKVVTRDDIIDALATKTSHFSQTPGGSGGDADQHIIDLLGGNRIEHTLREARQTESDNQFELGQYAIDIKTLDQLTRRLPLHLQEMVRMIAQRIPPKTIKKNLDMKSDEYQQLRYSLIKDLAERFTIRNGNQRAQVYDEEIRRY
jgi:hypothetical protein